MGRLNNFQRFYLSDQQISKARNNTISNQIFLFYYQNLLEDYLSIFKWEGLPENVPQYAIEWALLKYGHFVAWENEKIGLDENGLADVIKEIVFTNYTMSAYDNYFQPTQINILPLFPNNTNNYSGIKYQDEFEYCLNNISGYPTYDTIMFFVNMLRDIEVSIKLTTRQLRQPYLFEGTKGSKQSITQLMKKIDEGNIEYFVINKDFMHDGNLILHKLTDMEAPKRLETLYMLKEKYLQEWYTKIGTHTNINNKNERLTENESIGYNEIGNLHINGMLQMRKEFCERYNKHFNQNLSVTFSTDIRPIMQLDMEKDYEINEDIENGGELDNKQ